MPNQQAPLRHLIRRRAHLPYLKSQPKLGALCAMKEQGMERVLITDQVDQLLIDGLKDIGYHVHYEPDLSPEDFLVLAKHHQGIVHNSKIKLPAEILSALPDLRFIGRLGSGLEIIDLETAVRRGISVFSAPEGNCQAVAEHALGMLLGLFNKLQSADNNVRTMQWDREGHRGIELCGKTVGIVGFGHTGRAFARLLTGFDCPVLVHDKIKLDTSQFPNVSEVSMDDIHNEAEIVSIHVSYDPSLYHWIDFNWIKRFSKPIFLINTARGMVVHLADLMVGIKSGAIRGACLDVLENEKPTTFSQLEKDLYQELHQMEQVVLSPHVAGWTVESKRKIAEVLLAKIRAWHQTEKQT